MSTLGRPEQKNYQLRSTTTITTTVASTGRTYYCGYDVLRTVSNTYCSYPYYVLIIGIIWLAAQVSPFCEGRYNRPVSPIGHPISSLRSSIRPVRSSHGVRSVRLFRAADQVSPVRSVDGAVRSVRLPHPGPPVVRSGQSGHPVRSLRSKASSQVVAVSRSG